MTETTKEIEMFVAGLVLDPASNAPIVILKDPTTEACLPIWIGLAEATAIASALKRVELPRPMTHDLLKNVIDDLGGQVVRILINALHDGTFFSMIEMKIGDTFRAVDARPSDAIALAVRVSVPIYVREEVLREAQVSLVPVNPDEAVPADFTPNKSELEDKNFANIEKDKWADILAAMDPDDFKYKM